MGRTIILDTTPLLLLVEWRIQERLSLTNASRTEKLNQVRGQPGGLTFEHFEVLADLWSGADSIHIASAQLCETDDLLGGKLKSGSEAARRNELVLLVRDARVKETHWTMQDIVQSKWNQLLMRQGFADCCAVRLGRERGGLLVTEDRGLLSEGWSHEIECTDLRALLP